MTHEITTDPSEPHFYYCMDHDAVEDEIGCPGAVRLGPFATFEEATRALDAARARTESWDDEDRRWEGDTAPTG